MGTEQVARASMDARARTEDAGPAGAMLASPIEAVWVARPRPDGSAAEMLWPRRRQHKATRCGHCAFCHPHGSGGGVRLCTQPGRTATMVVGDQMVCGDFAPAAPPLSLDA